MLCVIYSPFAIVCLTIGATVFFAIPCSWQYFDCNHTESCLCPLLALHPQQQRAMFSLVMIFSSLMMCSQLAADFFEILEDVNGVLQYTHALSLARTSISSQAGIFHLFAMVSSFTHNVKLWPDRRRPDREVANSIDALVIEQALSCPQAAVRPIRCHRADKSFRPPTLGRKCTGALDNPQAAVRSESPTWARRN